MKDLLTQAGAIIAIIVFAGLALSFLKGSVYKGTIEALQTTVNAQKTRIETQDEELEDKDEELGKVKLELKSKDEKITVLERENKSLLQVRPSAEAITRLAIRLEDHHHESMDLLTKNLETVQDGFTALRGGGKS